MDGRRRDGGHKRARPTDSTRSERAPALPATRPAAAGPIRIHSPRPSPLPPCAGARRAAAHPIGELDMTAKAQPPAKRKGSYPNKLSPEQKVFVVRPIWSAVTTFLPSRRSRPRSNASSTFISASGQFRSCSSESCRRIGMTLPSACRASSLSTPSSERARGPHALMSLNQPLLPFLAHSRHRFRDAGNTTVPVSASTHSPASALRRSAPASSAARRDLDC
jgi:hypothetical protein